MNHFDRAFFEIGRGLQHDETCRERGQVTWTISPRKLKALYKIALAHALVRDEQFALAQSAPPLITPDHRDLYVFNLIWDSGEARERLNAQVHGGVAEHLPPES
jgi:hypothetical protein